MFYMVLCLFILFKIGELIDLCVEYTPLTQFREIHWSMCRIYIFVRIFGELIDLPVEYTPLSPLSEN